MNHVRQNSESKQTGVQCMIHIMCQSQLSLLRNMCYRYENISSSRKKSRRWRRIKWADQTLRRPITHYVTSFITRLFWFLFYFYFSFLFFAVLFAIWELLSVFLPIKCHSFCIVRQLASTGTAKQTSICSIQKCQLRTLVLLLVLASPQNTIIAVNICAYSHKIIYRQQILGVYEVRIKMTGHCRFEMMSRCSLANDQLRTWRNCLLQLNINTHIHGLTNIRTDTQMYVLYKWYYDTL